MPERLIVDGYNVLYAWARRPGAPPIPMARETLLRDLERAAATRGVRCTVVFDGRPIEDVAHASSALLEVLFAGPHSSADAVIERMVCRSPRQGQVVVTDDCNLTCSYCDEYTPGAPIIPLETMKARIDKLDDLGVLVYDFLGGETMMHPDIAQLVKIGRAHV